MANKPLTPRLIANKRQIAISLYTAYQSRVGCAPVQKRSMKFSWFLTGVLAVSIVTCCLPSSLLAGGGGENVVIAVNGESLASKRIANEYIALRDIPSVNVVYLYDVPEFEQTDVESFRDRILTPLLEEVDRRNIANQIDCIVYSADFPTAIDVSVDAKKAKIDEGQRKFFAPTASINALTYFYQTVLGGHPGYMSPDANWYMRLTDEFALRNPLLGADAKICDKAIALFHEQKYAEADLLFEQLLKNHASQCSLFYWRARCLARLDKGADATGALTAAVKAGWSYRAFLENDAVFDSIRDDIVYQELVSMLPGITPNDRPTSAFRSQYVWNRNGMRIRDTQLGKRFLLSTVLAVTRNRGTTVDEAVEYLKRAVAADGTRPDGKFVFTWTTDPRTTPRRPFFADTVRALEQLGYEGDIVPAALPKGEAKVLGATIGVATYDWSTTGCQLVPGAIGDNLTSTSGVMRLGAGQTPLTEFLTSGAAGASGTVTEPYNFPFKFPNPFIHVHYARGCSLAEAYYQSVHSPYQLLIVGDALCQPWARFPEFEVAGLSEGDEVKGAVQVEASVVEGAQVLVVAYDIFLDGRRVGRIPEGGKLNFDSKQLPDGYHELRVVALGTYPSESQSRKIIPFLVNNKGVRAELTISAAGNPELTGAVGVRVDCEAASTIEIMHHQQVVGTLTGSERSMDIPCELFGEGPVPLVAVATVEGMQVRSLPARFVVEGNRK